MKDAFGGAFILRIMLIFFAVFICFMAVAINISKTFRIKNEVISILQRSDPTELFSLSEEGGRTDVSIKIDDYLQSIAYKYTNNSNITNNCKNNGGTLTGNGVCIVEYNNGSNKVYYKVIAYIVIDFPLFHLGTVIPISGETKTIYY